MSEKQTLTIGWLYPDLMSIYGDRGNIITLTKRCEWRDIAVTVRPLTLGFSKSTLSLCDILFMGGAQDSQQKLVAEDLMQKKSLLATHIEDGKPGLFICGAYQFLGTYYKEADGTVIPGLGIFDIHTIHPGLKSKRLVGNLLADSTHLLPHAPLETIVGFENHGGRTYLGDNCTPFASVKKGYGNNGEDKTEGAVLKNSIGSYCHGPLLPKNPHVADFLIQKALEKKYNTSITLSALDDSLSYSAHHLIAKRM